LVLIGAACDSHFARYLTYSRPILGVFLDYSYIWGPPGPSWALLGSPGSSWGLLALLGSHGLSWTLQGSPGPSCGLLCPPGLSWALLGSPGLSWSSWALLGPPGLSWALLASPGLSWALLQPCARLARLVIATLNAISRTPALLGLIATACDRHFARYLTYSRPLGLHWHGL
jgi:hypothetical protein